MRTLELSPQAYADVLMLGSGGYAPLTGFMTLNEYRSVLRRSRLPEGQPWGLPIVLPMESTSEVPDTLGLNFGGHTVATLHVTDVFSLDPDEEMDWVYGTRDGAHPSVHALAQRPLRAVGGAVGLLGTIPDSPAEVRAALSARGWTSVAGFQTRNALHRGHEKLLEHALSLTDGLLLHPLTGPTKAGDLSVAARMESYAVSLRHLPAGRVLLRPYPAAMRYAGPREALTHAVSRRNYGVTHFLIGRDHAGVGSYYAPDAAQQFLRSFTEAELGVKLLPMPEVAYCAACGDMVIAGECGHARERLQPISGTAVRSALRTGTDLPAGLFRPDVARALTAADPERPTSR